MKEGINGVVDVRTLDSFLEGEIERRRMLPQPPEVGFVRRQPGAVDALLAQPEIAQIFPMARKVEHPNGDLIDFGDGNGPVDVIRGAVAGGSGAAWQWGAGGGEAPSGPGGPSAMAYQGGIPQQAPTGQMDNTGMPEVMDQGSAMEFLNWLMSQQQQGQQQQGMI